MRDLEKQLATGIYEVDEENNEGKTALFLAMNPFNVEMARFLVKKGAKAHSAFLFNMAIENEDMAAVRFWVENKAEIDAEFLNHALKKPNNQIALLLMAHGAPLTPPRAFCDIPLHLAVKNEDMPMVKLMLKKGAPLARRDAHGDTPLHLAAKNDNLPMIKLLVAFGAEPNALNDRGFFSLRCCS